jgi:hypothetical protein
MANSSVGNHASIGCVGIGSIQLLASATLTVSNLGSRLHRGIPVNRSRDGWFAIDGSEGLRPFHELRWIEADRFWEGKSDRNGRTLVSD